MEEPKSTPRFGKPSTCARYLGQLGWVDLWYEPREGGDEYTARWCNLVGEDETVWDPEDKLLEEIRQHWMSAGKPELWLRRCVAISILAGWVVDAVQ